MSLHETLLRYEHALAVRDPDGLDRPLVDLIADDFLEFGASGRVWDATSIRELLAGPTTDAFVFEAFHVQALAADVALITYRVVAPTPANRSSVWVRRDGRWRMRFHQGTRIP